ncbi:MAG: hypothetical protein ACP5GJ_02440 [Nanopusillaceae archaeon]
MVLMGKKDKVLFEIKELLEKLRKDKGLYIIESDGKVIYSLYIYYTNIEYQRKYVNDLLKKHNISKRYYGFFRYLLSDYVRVRVYEAYISKKVKTLEKVRDDLKRIYDNFDEKVYLDKLEKEINNIFENDLWLMNKYIDDMNKLRELEDYYLKFLDKKGDYDFVVRQFENEIINGYITKYKYRITKIIKDRIKKIINDNNFSLIWIKNGFALIVNYRDKYFENGEWVYIDNAFYLIDLRNKGVFDVSKKIDEFVEKTATKEISSYNFNMLKRLKLEDLLI